MVPISVTWQEFAVIFNKNVHVELTLVGTSCRPELRGETH